LKMIDGWAASIKLFQCPTANGDCVGAERVRRHLAGRKTILTLMKKHRQITRDLSA
jgi:hypothetical protein